MYTIGVFVYLALSDGPDIFTQDYTCPMLLWNKPKRLIYFRYGTITLYGAPFQVAFPINEFCNSFVNQMTKVCPNPFAILA